MKAAAEINFNKRMDTFSRKRTGEENILLPLETRLSDPYNTTREKHSFLLLSINHFSCTWTVCFRGARGKMIVPNGEREARPNRFARNANTEPNHIMFFLYQIVYLLFVGNLGAENKSEMKFHPPVFLSLNIDEHF